MVMPFADEKKALMRQLLLNADVLVWQPAGGINIMTVGLRAMAAAALLGLHAAGWWQAQAGLAAGHVMLS